MSYLIWAIIGLLAYSVVAPLISIVTEDVQPTVGLLLATIVFLFISFIVMIINGAADPELATTSEAIYVYLAGVCLAFGILAYVSALELGPVSIVVPIYGTFIVGSSVIGIVFLGETLTVTRTAGVACAFIAVILGAGE